jgi:MFS family permease
VNRARIINWSLVLFSVMTAACGLATSYWQFLLARIGVAIGEGGTNPPSQLNGGHFGTGKYEGSVNLTQVKRRPQ